MTMIPTVWVALGVTSLIVVTLLLAGLLGGLLYAAIRTERMLKILQLQSAPRFHELLDQVNSIAGRVDAIAAKVDREAVTTLPKVESMLDKVDHATDFVEQSSERVHHMLEGTSEGIHKVKHSPLTRQLLIGAGTLAAARYAKSAYDHMFAHAGQNGNGKH